MGFFVTILGSGASMPTGHRSCSAQVVNVEGYKILIDAGESVQNQMRKAHLKMQSIETVLISHLHGDHFFGLPGLISSMHLCGRTEPLNIYAPNGLQEVLETIFRVSKTQLNFPINYCALCAEDKHIVMENQKCRIFSFPIYHSIEAYGFIIEERKKKTLSLMNEVRQKYDLSADDILNIKQGQDFIDSDGTVVPNHLLTQPPKPIRKYAYCCDTAYHDNLISVVEGVNLLCFDSTFDTKNAELAISKGHGTATQAATLAKKAEVGQLMLTHFSARFKDIKPLVEEAKSIFPNTIAAADLAVVEVLSQTPVLTPI